MRYLRVPSVGVIMDTLVPVILFMLIVGCIVDAVRSLLCRPPKPPTLNINVSIEVQPKPQEPTADHQ